MTTLQEALRHSVHIEPREEVAWTSLNGVHYMLIRTPEGVDIWKVTSEDGYMERLGYKWWYKERRQVLPQFQDSSVFDDLVEVARV